jgi:hypothetical protein
MLTMTQDRLGTIQRASRAMLVLFILMSVIFVWSALSNLARPLPADSRTLAGVVFEGAAISDKIHTLWLVQLVLGAALGLKVLYHFIRLMMMYSRGELFTSRSVGQIRQVGLTFALGVAVWFVALIGAAPEIMAARDQWSSIMPSFPGGSIMGACLFLFASRIIDEGRKLRDEQDLVV